MSEIKEIVTAQELENSVKVIADSFATVAAEFKLTKENCPTHPSLITLKQVSEMQRKGLKLFGLFDNGVQTGFVAVEKKNNHVYLIEKLAVLPDNRHKGHGGELLAFVADYAKTAEGKTLSIGIINEHKVLKEWYKTKGFTEKSLTKFEHLPFTVCFMEKALE